MNTGGEAAEQIVRMSLEGFEVAAKITGAGAKNIAPFWKGAESLYRKELRPEKVYAGGKKIRRTLLRPCGQRKQRP